MSCFDDDSSSSDNDSSNDDDVEDTYDHNSAIKTWNKSNSFKTNSIQK